MPRSSVSPAIIATAALAVAAVGVWIWISSAPPRPVAVATPTPALGPAPVIAVGGKPTLGKPVAMPSPASPAPVPPTVESAVVPGMPQVRTTPPPASPALKNGVPETIVGPIVERADIEMVQMMFRDYRTRMGENPVGSNAEIMKAVMGNNPVGARLGPPEGQKLNERGELVDQWGNAYFFHQMSKDKMEIRSAGPDGVMWTPDDIVTK